MHVRTHSNKTKRQTIKWEKIFCNKYDGHRVNTFALKVLFSKTDDETNFILLMKRAGSKLIYHVLILLKMWYRCINVCITYISHTHRKKTGIRH